MLKICQICSILPPGRDSVGEGALKLKLLLEAKGFTCFILTSLNQNTGNDIIPFFSKWNIINAIRSIDLLKKKAIETVIFHYPTSYYKRNISVSFFTLVYRIFNLKTIAFIHEFSSYTLKGKLRIIPLILFSHRIITTDHENLNWITKIPGAKKKTRMVSVGSNFPDSLFNCEAIHNIKREFRIDRNKISLLYFGYIMQGKGLDILLDSFENSVELNKKFSLHLVGNIPEIPNKETILLLNRINESNSITYHGYLDNQTLAKFIKEIDFVVLPFLNGVTIRRGSFMASMAFGKPVLTTKSRANIDGLNHGENVIFIDSLEKSEIIRSLQLILEIDKSKADKIGRKAKEWYFNNYSENIYIKRIIEVINFHKK